jgi:hypothetical protein
MTPQELADEALILLDVLTMGTPLDHDIRGRLYVMRLAAIKHVREKYPHRKIKRDWCGKMGIHRTTDRHEEDYACMFCRESLATLGRKGMTLAPKFVDKLDVHTRRCGLLWKAPVEGGVKVRWWAPWSASARRLKGAA